MLLSALNYQHQLQTLIPSFWLDSILGKYVSNDHRARVTCVSSATHLIWTAHAGSCQRATSRSAAARRRAPTPRACRPRSRTSSVSRLGLWVSWSWSEVPPAVKGCSFVLRRRHKQELKLSRLTAKWVSRYTGDTLQPSVCKVLTVCGTRVDIESKKRHLNRFKYRMCFELWSTALPNIFSVC